MPIKSLRKLCGKLRDDGMLSEQIRAARRTDGSASYFGGKDGALGKERMTQHNWVLSELPPRHRLDQIPHAQAQQAHRGSGRTDDREEGFDLSAV